MNSITHYLKVTNITLKKLMQASNGKIPYAQYGMDVDSVIRSAKQGWTDADNYVSLLPIIENDKCLAVLDRFKQIVDTTPYPGDAVEIITNTEAEALKPSLKRLSDF